MNKITKKSLEYLYIIYLIFSLVDYYGKLFSLDAGESPADIPVDIFEENNITFLRFSFSKIGDDRRGHTIFDMQKIYNEYLNIVLLPSQNFLKPYKNGPGIYDIIEPLYVDSIFENEDTLFLDIVYINSPLSYAYVREQEKCRI